MAVRWSLAAAGVTLLVAACTSAPADGGSEVEADGAPVRLGPGVERPLDWTLEERFRLGGAESGPESFYHVLAETVAVDGADRIYVLDIVAQRVEVFGADGAHLRTIGSRGQGPGELAEATGLHVSADGVVDVYDFGKGALVRFDAVGEPIEQERLDVHVDGRISRVLGTLVYSWADRGASADSVIRRLTIDREGSSAMLAAIAEPRRPRVRFGACNTVPAVIDPVFRPELIWGAHAGRIAVARADAYRIDVYDGLTLTHRVGRDLPSVEATRSLAIRQLGRGLPTEQPSGEVCYVPPEQVVDEVGFARWIPQVAAVAVAPDGALWVTRALVGDAPGPIDVFDAAGDYRGTLRAGTPRPLAFLSDGSVLSAESDSFDVERLVVYDVRREGGSERLR